MQKKSAMDVFMEQQAAPMEEEDFDDGFMSEEPAPPAMQQQNMSVPMSPPPRSKKRKAPSKPIPASQIKTSEELQLAKEPIRVRETGFWFWRRVIVPPNAYVVHTRINKNKPITIGLGFSFRFNPNKDAYMVIPASMQTIGVVANCISKEKQGINILAYVQWQIDDIAIAYRKLDFSDSRDPLAIVNAQLREQAEAAIKDKIATMSVEEALTDKAPVITELTKRLKAVTEEQDKVSDEEKYEGLGIKIITVQIREAFVSSQSLWTDLQSPFRYEKTKMARVSYLNMQNEIKEKELQTRKELETREAETRVEIESIKQKTETEALELKLLEESERFKREQEAKQKKIQQEEISSLTEIESREKVQAKENELTLLKELEIVRNEDKKAEEEAKISLEAANRQVTMETQKQLHRIAQNTRLLVDRMENRKKQLEEEKVVKALEADFNRVVQEQNAALEGMVMNAKVERDRLEKEFQLEYREKLELLEEKKAEHKAKVEGLHQEAKNLINDKELMNRLIARLPEIAARMPSPDELKIIRTGEGKHGSDALLEFVTKMLSVLDMLGIKVPGKQ